MRALKYSWFLVLISVFAFSACGGDADSDTGDKPDDQQQVTPPVGSVGDGPALDGSIFPEPGAKEFVTANEKEMLSTGTGDYRVGHNAGAEFGGGYADDAAAPSGADPGAEPAPMPEPDPTREIVEADIFRLEGDTLYVLNSYRGLVVIDLSQPDQPEVIGRLPFQATPVDMYVRDGRAYIVMSDYFVYWQYDPDADPLGFHGSQVLIVDVNDPTEPKKLGSLPVDGEVTDTRMVGDVLYAVSKRNSEYWRYNTADWEDRTWIVSLNIADPSEIKEIDRITFQGTSTLIHVAPHAIFVAAVDPNYYLYSDEFEQETLVTYVDIADPAGALAERGSVYVPGRIADKFKMDYYDATLRVFTQRWYGSSNGYLVNVDLSFPDQLDVVAQLAIDEEIYGYLQATRFDQARAYAMTTRYVNQDHIQELHTFDLAQATNPVQAATLEIEANISHFETRGDRLVALGRSTAYHDGRVEVMLFDVTDIKDPALLSEAKLGDDYSWSEAINDYKAFRIVDEIGLVMVPLSYYDDATKTSFNGTQLISWQGDVLDSRGQVGNVSRVRRAFVAGDRLVAFSERQLQVIDAGDLDAPVVTAEVYFIRNVLDVFDVQGKQVQLIGDTEGGGIFFEVLPFGPDDDAEALAHLDLPYSSAPYCIREGDVMHMIGYEPNVGQVIRNADFSAVLDPTLKGKLELTTNSDSVYVPGFSFYNYYWNPTSGLALEGRILPFTERELVEQESGRREWDSRLRLLDLSDVDNPRIADGTVPMNDYPFVNKMTHGTTLWSTHVEEAKTQDGDTLYYHVRSYVDRIDVSDPDNPVELASINIPGMLVDTSDDGEVLYTVDFQWDDFGRRRNSLNMLRLDGDEAVLTEVIPVSDQVNRAVFRDRTIWLVAHKYPWWGVGADTLQSRQPYTVLHKFVVGQDGSLASEAAAKVEGYHFDLLDTDDSLIYLASRWPYGLLVLDASDPTAPEIVHSARSIGYISRIVPHDGFIYTPLGYYGVHRTGTGQ